MARVHSLVLLGKAGEGEYSERGEVLVGGYH
jgi:hypothetical protein